VPILPVFEEVAADQGCTLDVMALSLAAEFRDVDASGALGRLDALADELRSAVELTDATPEEVVRACRALLGGVHGFAGDREGYDRPENSMLDLVLTRRRGLPILLSAVYVEVARRAGGELSPVGLPGHFVVGHFGVSPPLLLDPFDGGAALVSSVPAQLVRPWSVHQVAMRMLNNLVMAFERRGNLGAALQAARMRTVLPASAAELDGLRHELRVLQSRLN
jgi:regulator of sirC expression with transglutaminase-like and TPR domain